MREVTIGVDPGLGGAVAIYCAADNTCQIVDSITREIPGAVTAKVKRELDGGAMADAVWEAVAGCRVRTVCIERVGSRPRQSPATTFSLGHSFGAVCAMLETLFPEAELLFVTPNKWKPALGLDAAEGKNTSRALAISLCPDSAPHLKRVKDHDRAEALLLAIYAVNYRR